MDVAFNTNSILEEYSASSDLSKSLAAQIPYGVAAPEMPSKLTDIFIQTASSVCGSSVLKIFRANGFKILETARETPLSSHTFISPNQTE